MASTDRPSPPTPASPSDLPDAATSPDPEASELPNGPKVPGATLRRGVFFGLLAGATPLIPIPFLDDWAWEWVRKRAAHESLKAQGLRPQGESVSILAGTEDRSWAEGCALSVLFLPIKLILYVVKKIFRKLVIFLLIKDCADRLSRLVHETALIEHAAATERLADRTDPAPPVPEDAAWTVRRAMKETLRLNDPRPVEAVARKAIRGSRQLLKEASRLLGAALRSLRGTKRRTSRRVPNQAVTSDAVPLEAEHELLSGLVDSLSEDLDRKSGYFQALLLRFESALAAQRSGEDAA